MSLGNVLIFAGAGASKAVAPDVFPTTVEFFNNLPQSLKTHPLFLEVERFLKKSEKPEAIDIELILWRLQELLEFCEEAIDHSRLAGWMIGGNRLANALGQQSNNTGHLTTIASAAVTRLKELIGSINARVYEHYSRLPEPTALKNNWSALLDGCAKLSHQVEIVTTNYDMVIESALDTHNVADNGWRGTVVRYLDTEVWASDASTRPKGLLTKLHGSVNWTRDQNRIYVSDPMFKGSHDTHAIIYPGFKGRPSDPVFQLFHSHFRKRLDSAVVAIFIGFAFRDEYINDICERSITTRTATIVINPVKVTLPFVTDRHKYIEASFDIASVSEALAFARSSIIA